MKLAKLRELMESVAVGGLKAKGIQAVIVNTEDAHQSEYLREADERRKFISGFKGSLGTAVITANQALLWTDGRYFAQALSELDPPEAWILMKEGVIGTPTQAEWLAKNLPPKSTVGADPSLLSYNVWLTLHTTLTTAGHSLLALQENLVDQVWGDERPSIPKNKIVPQTLRYTGKKAGEKVELCREAMVKNGATVLVITALDEVAYLLNLRGSDIAYNPVFFAYVIITLQDLHFFVDKSRLTPEAERQLRDEGVNPKFHSYEEMRPFVKQLASTLTENDKVWINNEANCALHAEFGDVRKHTAITPVCLMKSVKNEVEIAGLKHAHIKDAVALVKYFAWLEDQIKNKVLVTEISGATQLEKFRQKEEGYVGLSFNTISSMGAHGAIIHYAPSPESDIPITDESFYLCDSGAQFYDGTTDVTRTLHFGIPTDYERECFTRVFKGQYALSTAIFPVLLKGNYLDTLARKSLWDVGLNYLHGTGHGIGAYLNVHEMPIHISWRPYPNDPGLQAGNFISNEPGYYEDGKFGIRLENIELVVKVNTRYQRENQEFLTFETVTLVPIQTNILDMSLLTQDEIEYLNRYHEKCWNILSPLLQGEDNTQALAWLRRETQPISKDCIS
ncbi:xaa-Pro aminopeptidase ApepP isoform X2 [Cephus cinctus]|nr:xaa-Pro aminopeptidase ApepP isoform X2 [Cephus cinctus]